MALSYTLYTGDGSNTDFNVVFGYISRSHVSVYLDGVEDPEFTWVSASQVRMDTPPANGVVVKVQRLTPNTARLVNFQNGSTLDADNDLDADSNQNFFLIQEAYDIAVDGQIEGPIGASGTDGATILSGSGVPSDGTGNNGDLYIRTSNGALYVKAAGTWGAAIVNLTGPTGATGSTGATGPAGSTIASYSGEIADAEDRTYTIDLYCPVGGTINLLTTKTSSGTCTAKLKINATDVTGSSHSVTSSEAAGTCTADNVFVVGDTISLVISSSSSPTDLAFSIKITL